MKKIGEIFEYKGIKLITEEYYDGCEDCYFFDLNNGCRNRRFHCTDTERSDSKYVIFRKYSFKFGK